MLRIAVSLALFAVSAFASAAPWIYRGSLSDAGVAANGRNDFRLTVIDGEGALSGVEPITLFDVAVQDGSFAVEVDFGINLATQKRCALVPKSNKVARDSCV